MNDVLLRILDDLFRACMIDPDGVDTDTFQIKHEDYLEQIEWLQRFSYIDRTNDHKYRIRLISILKLAELNEDAKNLIKLCGQIYTALGEIYRANPKASVSLNKLAQIVKVSRPTLNFALIHMEVTHAISARSTDFPYKEDEEVTLGNDLLRCKTFKDQIDHLLDLQSRLENRENETSLTYPIIEESLGDIQIGFENLLHPKIIEVSLKQYRSRNFRGAVLDSIISVFDKIREKTGLRTDGAKLVGKAFSMDDPYLIFSHLDDEGGENDQKGFMQILTGVYQGIRNRKSHTLEHDLNEHNSAQYLVLASLLARRIDEAHVMKTENN